MYQTENCVLHLHIYKNHLWSCGWCLVRILLSFLLAIFLHSCSSVWIDKLGFWPSISGRKKFCRAGNCMDSSPEEDENKSADISLLCHSCPASFKFSLSIQRRSCTTQFTFFKLLWNFQPFNNLCINFLTLKMSNYSHFSKCYPNEAATLHLLLLVISGELIYNVGDLFQIWTHLAFSNGIGYWSPHC